MLRKVLIDPSSHLIVQLIRYGIVVVIAFPIDIGLLYVFTDKFHIYYVISTILSFSISMAVNFCISVFWVFKDRTERAMWREISIFFLIGFVGLGLTAFLVWLLTSVFGLYYLVSKLIAVVFVFFWSFGARRFFFHTRLSGLIENYRQRKE